MFWKREIFDKIGYIDESFHAKMDVEWLIRVYEAGLKVRRINRNLGAIRIYPETKTAQGGAIWKRDTDALREMYHGKYLPENGRFYRPFFNPCFRLNRREKDGKSLRRREVISEQDSPDPPDAFKQAFTRFQTYKKRLPHSVRKSFFIVVLRSLGA